MSDLTYIASELPLISLLLITLPAGALLILIVSDQLLLANSSLTVKPNCLMVNGFLPRVDV